MLLKGGRLKACFPFFTPLGMYPKDPRFFLRFPLTSFIFMSWLTENQREKDNKLVKDA